MQHLQTHAHFRPYICPMCDAGFTSSSALEAHSRLHRQDQTRDQRVETRDSHLHQTRDQRDTPPSGGGYRENPPNREAPRNNNLR